MNTFKLLLTAGAASLLLFSCQKSIQDPAADTLKNNSAELEKKKGMAGYVYTLDNQASGNHVMIFSRTAGGKIEYLSSEWAAGNGTGAGLGSQGSIVLSENGKWLIAINAGSNSVSAFSVDGAKVKRLSNVSSVGIKPISVAIYDDLVYVLNGGGTGKITGFKLDANGKLHHIMGSTRPLTTSASGPAQISFVNDGSAVVVTEKATNRILSYTIDAMGIPGAMHWINSAAKTPFGFAEGKKGTIYVSEAEGGAPNASAVSAYHVDIDGTITHTGGPIYANQSAACWVVVTNNYKYVYATNTASNTVSSFSPGSNGALSLLTAIAGETGSASVPIDAALTSNSKFLYVLNSGNQTIRGYEVEGDGGLEIVDTEKGLPIGAIGLAAN